MYSVSTQSTWDNRILQRVREELKPEAERDTELLAMLVKLFDDHRQEEMDALAHPTKAKKKSPTKKPKPATTTTTAGGTPPLPAGVVAAATKE
eukprot:NODE_2260_length_376_cov_254.024096_g2250_i0.p2 GENE.NODE_2260_length_376_cov_254.024096_g2250_i0~~NODE_2260_length_376_cov_254.024096_g2250_i0.p2  ORF type:complete len:100 (+),score=43.26 NODE_2260_length_376_cov_254.024096_g2250_i0:23-301(+)